MSPTTAPTLTLRAAEPRDVPAIVAANNAEVPAVSELDDATALDLLELADHALVAEVDDAFAGFVFALPDGLDEFGAMNYRWFEEHLDDYLYVERIVVADGHQGRGIGRRFYDRLLEVSDRAHFCSEVNTVPRNDASLAFHDRYGFEPIGELTYGDGITCAKLARRT